MKCYKILYVCVFSSSHHQNRKSCWIWILEFFPEYQGYCCSSPARSVWSDPQQEDCYGAITRSQWHLVGHWPNKPWAVFPPVWVWAILCCFPAIKFPHLVSSVCVSHCSGCWKEDNKKCELGALLAASLDWNRSGVDIWSCLNHSQVCYRCPYVCVCEKNDWTFESTAAGTYIGKTQRLTQLMYKLRQWESGGF